MVDESSRSRPLVIQDARGKVIDLGLMNDKAYKKSLENKVLWVVDKETGRVLPYKEEVLPVTVSTVPFGYLGVLTEAAEAAVLNKHNVPEKPEEAEKSSRGISPSEKKAGNAGEHTLGVLNRLCEIIALRHEQMPEGSYTTHLFSSGGDKIRKKLGEEAVEVILAKTDREILSESADLIYHLLVFLEFCGLSLDQVLKVLESRE